MTPTIDDRIFLARGRNPEGRWYHSTEDKIRQILGQAGYMVECNPERLPLCRGIVGVSLGATARAVKKTEGKIPSVLIGFSDSAFLKISDDEKDPELCKVKAYSKVGKILVSTDSEKEFLEKKAADAAPIEVFPMTAPCDWKKKTPEPEKYAVIRHWCLDSAKPLLVCLGRLNSERQTAAAIGLARMLPDCEFALLGIDPKQKNDPQRLVEKSKLVNFRSESQIRMEFYRSLMANASALIVLDPWYTDLPLLADAFMSRIPVYAPEMKLLKNKVIPDTHYIRTEGNAIDIYGTIKSSLERRSEISARAYELAAELAEADCAEKIIQSLSK